VLDTFPQPLPDGQVRLTVLYEFEVPSKHGRTVALGYSQANHRFQVVADPVVPADQLTAWQCAFTKETPVRRVFFELNDPVGTAFMVSEAVDGQGFDYRHGMILLVFGLVMWGNGYLARGGQRKAA